MKVSSRLRILTGFSVGLAALVVVAAAMIVRNKTDYYSTGNPTHAVSQHVLLNSALAFAAFAVVIGVASMAVVQTAKNLTLLRGRLQSAWVKEWLDIRGGDHVATHPTHGDPWKQLLSLLNKRQTLYDPRDLPRFFNLPIEQVAGQIASGADHALGSPGEYEAFLRAFAGPSAQTEHEHTDALKRLLDLGPVRAADARVDPRPDVGTRLQRGIDALQISVGDRWRRFMRLAANAVAFTLGLAVALFEGRDAAGARVAFVAVSLVFGGFVAWTSRDILAAIERLRQGT